MKRKETSTDGKFKADDSVVNERGDWMTLKSA